MLFTDDTRTFDLMSLLFTSATMSYFSRNLAVWHTICCKYSGPPRLRRSKDLINNKQKNIQQWEKLLV